MDISSAIVYRDQWLMVVNKPAGIASQPDPTGDVSVLDMLQKYLIGDIRSKAFVGITHRIDRPVSGVMLFALSADAVNKINDLFRNNSVKKTYWAVVRQAPPKPNDVLTHYLVTRNQKAYCYNEPQNNGQKAVLEYNMLQQSDNYTLLEVVPRSGRFHQIRSQLAHIGCTIKGDVKYGDRRANNDRSIHLHARRIEFVHPYTKQTISVQAPPPNESLWDFFAQKITS